MIGCGTTTYTDPDDFRANVPGVSITFEKRGGGAFKARVIWVKMRCIALASIDEAAPRSACLTSVAPFAVLSFPLRGEQTWDGRRLCRGDFVVQPPGGRVTHSADGSTRWGMIAITRKDIAAYSRTLLGTRLQRADAARAFRPRAKSTNILLRLHAQACRLAATKPDIIAHQEVARALEQELIVALMHILAAAESA
jgi:hypothetical protein